MGVAWNENFTKFNDEASWNSCSIAQYDNKPECDFQGGIWNHEEGWLMSYGFGPRFIFLGMPFKLDYAWQYDPFEGKKSDKKWYLSIGLDF